MKISELIKALKKLDPNLYVVTLGYEGGFCDVVLDREPFDLILNYPDYKDICYYGPHESSETTEDYPTVQALCI